MLSDSDVISKTGISGKITSNKGMLSKQEIILDMLGTLGPMTRVELMEHTGIKWTTLYDNLEKLALKHLVVNYSSRKSARGRPHTIWKLAR
ncbi:MAG: hypothetical protein ACTSP4_14700 [Candidatus Hodarchaeales archaeon]